MDSADPTINWLLETGDPSIQYFTLTDLADQPPESKEVKGIKENIPKAPVVRTLLDGQLADGGFGNHPYSKWTGAHWRLVSLVELGIPQGFKPAVKATGSVLDWLTGKEHMLGVKQINGLTRRCASQEGNALAVCSRLGLAKNPRVEQLATSLVKWQWPDGGWNCDRKEEVTHSSFNESLLPLWGLVEYNRATGDTDARLAADRAAEFFLKHRIFRSCRTNKERPPETFHGEMFRAVHPWTQIHYPAYWHYDILQALIVLLRAGKLTDTRTSDAVDLILKKRGADGLWSPDNFYWSMKRTPKSNASNVEIVDWGRKGANKMITLNSLRVLKAAGRIH